MIAYVIIHSDLSTSKGAKAYRRRFIALIGKKSLYANSAMSRFEKGECFEGGFYSMRSNMIE